MASGLSRPAGAWGTKDQALANARRLLATDPASAEQQAREIISADPGDPAAHRILALALRRLGRDEEAADAETEAIDASLLQPAVFEAAMALAEQQLQKAERLLRPHLAEQPDDAAALRMLAEVAARLGHLETAERLVGHALTVAPDYKAAMDLAAAVADARAKASGAPAQSIRGAIALDERLSGEHTYAEPLRVYGKLVERFPDNPQNHVGYGHVLRTVGRQDEAIAQYRRAIALQAASGEAWVAIGDLKSARFEPGDVDTLRALVADPATAAGERAPLNFALGRALEQSGDHEAAFAAYAAGNALRAGDAPHDPAAVARHVDRSIALFDADFFRTRAQAGEPARDPIFVLGMPRAGSTLIEQILASHPEIEGVGELQDIQGLANWLGDGRTAGLEDSDYLSRLASLPGDELLKLGRGYLWNAGLRRRTAKPLFVDKMPNNWLHLGLILTVLPNARIIDARRHPLACGMSNYRQYFAKGQAFSYDLAHIGRFYADYVRMMDHFDRLMPGRVHRVAHEALVADPEAEVRRLLDYIGVAFDAGCLRFHENPRAVRTASSEQVRRPITRDALDEWRRFDPWLGPLKDALGPLADGA